MSKLGKKPIVVPAGVTASISDGTLSLKGKLGTISIPLLSRLNIVLKEGNIEITPQGGETQARANWGTMAALIKNALQGIEQGFSKILEIEGIGFRATMDGTTLVLNVGFTHPVKFTPPEGIKVQVEKNKITVSGISKEAVGEVAAKIRRVKKPEPYKGKGIHYLGEVIRRKAGKKVAGATAEK